MPNLANRRATIAIFFLMFVPASAQFSGRVSGTVVDPSGTPVAGAEVALAFVNGSLGIEAICVDLSGCGHITYFSCLPNSASGWENVREETVERL